MELKITDNAFETGVIVTSEGGSRLEAVVVHLPGTDTSTFYLAHVQYGGENEEPVITDLFSCPVDAA